jgi:AcrR family transcriptional regulator
MKTKIEMTKKQKIVRTALHLFVQNGIENTPTTKIIAEAGVATGTLFYHFRNKEELINALYLGVKKSISKAMSIGIKEVKDDKGSVHHIWNNFITWGIKNPVLFQFNAQFYESPIIIKNAKQHLTEGTSQFLLEIIEERLQNKISRDLPVDFLASLATSLLMRSARYFSENPAAFKDPLIANEAFECFWGMLTKPE